MHQTAHLNSLNREWLTEFPPALESSFSLALTCQDFLLIRLTVCLTPRLLSFSSLMCFFCLQEADTCQHCGGSGCAPCSLCHGSKLSMLANRFNESISDLRCQACYPHGLEKCQSCSSEQHRLADSRAPQRTSQWTRARRCVWRSAVHANGSTELPGPQFCTNPECSWWGVFKARTS